MALNGLTTIKGSEATIERLAWRRARTHWKEEAIKEEMKN